MTVPIEGELTVPVMGKSFGASDSGWPTW